MSLKDKLDGIGAVLYTDGACGGYSVSKIDNDYKGYIGAGYHGYFYNEDEVGQVAKKHHKGVLPSITGYVDETLGLLPSIKFVTPTHYIDGMANELERGYVDIAEFLALKKGLINLFNYSREIGKDLKILLLNIDSSWMVEVANMAYALYPLQMTITEDTDNLTYFKRYKHLNTDRDKYGKALDVLENNGNYYKTFHYVLDILKVLQDNSDILDKFKYYNAVYVKAHNGEFGNELVDKLAVSARNLAKEQITVDTSNLTDEKTYWKETKNTDYMYRYNNLYFKLNKDIKTETGKYELIIMNYTGDQEVGTKQADVLYGYVITDEIDSKIEDTIKRYNKLYEDEPILLYAISRKELYNKQLAKYYWLPDNAYLYPDYKKRKLLSIYNNDVAYPIYPTGLPKIVYERTEESSRLLSKVVDCVENDIEDKFITIIDITDKVYGLNEKGKKACIMGNKDKTITLNVDVKHFGKNKIVLYENVDYIARNDLKGMEKDDVKMYFVTVPMGKDCFEYYTVLINKTENSYGIYHNFYSSRVFTKK